MKSQQDDMIDTSKFARQENAPAVKPVNWGDFEFKSQATKDREQNNQRYDDGIALQKTQYEQSRTDRAAEIARSEAFTLEQTQKNQEFQMLMQQNSGGGGGGCFITTATVNAIGSSYGEEILNEFRVFRDSWLKNQPNGDELIARYYEIAPIIVEKIGDSISQYEQIWTLYLMPCRNLLNAGENKSALALYSAMCDSLEEKYL
jgi:hypothetical protein